MRTTHLTPSVHTWRERPAAIAAAAHARGLERTVARIALVAVAYVLGAQAGLGFALVGGSASPIWPPSGIAVAAAVLGGPVLLVGVAIGALTTNLASGMGPFGAAIAATGAVTEAALAAFLLRRVGFRPQLDRLVDVPSLAFLGALVPALVGATIGVAGLLLAGSAGRDDVPLAWTVWLAGDALAIVVVGGLLLTWLTPAVREPLRDRPIEAVVSLASVIVVSVFFFYDVLDLRSSGQAVAFPIFPLVVWVAFRIGPRGAALAAVAFSAIAIAATDNGLGPFVGTTRESTLLYLDVFIALVTVSGAGVAAVVAERDADRGQLEQSRRRDAEALRRLQAVEAIGRTLAADGPTSDCLDSIVGALDQVFGYSHPSIYTGDEYTLRLGAQRGYASIVGEVDSTSGVMGRVMRTREAQLVPDVTADPDFVRADPQVVSEISCPLLSRGTLLGVINVESGTTLDEGDLLAVSVVADRVAAALALALEREKLADLAVHDPLTALHNRRHFDGAMEQLRLARARLADDARSPLAVIMFDLDHFGAFNKLHGHQTGDAALRAFAAIVRTRFRATDIVARYGGEEFVAVLPGSGVADAAAIAESVRAALADVTITGPDGQPLHVSVSAGCAGSDDPRSSPEALLQTADVGLAMAKRSGRDRIVTA